MSPKIYISPSDQDKNIYASGKTNEAQQCRKIALAAVDALNRCGFSAKTDVKAEMEDRVDQSNLWGADVHLSIHTNATTVRFREHGYSAMIHPARDIGCARP